jgi:hypothetical protein
MRGYSFVLDVLDKAGVLVPIEQSFKPDDGAACVTFLGVNINSARMCDSAFADKVVKL